MMESQKQIRSRWKGKIRNKSDKKKREREGEKGGEANTVLSPSNRSLVGSSEEKAKWGGKKVALVSLNSFNLPQNKVQLRGKDMCPSVFGSRVFGNQGKRPVDKCIISV